jgi:hypothetical protein
MNEQADAVRRIPAFNRWWPAAVLGALLLAPAHAGDLAIQTEALVAVNQVVRDDGAGCQSAAVNYHGLVVRNPYVRRNLEALRCGLIREGHGGVEVVVSGGESYVGPAGRVISVSNHENIEPRNRRSAHNVENGARAVDIRRDPGLSDAAFRAVLRRYTAFVEADHHYSGHWHLRLPARSWDCPARACSVRPTAMRVAAR